MLTLESYLNDGIHRDRDDIDAIERVLRETAQTLAKSFVKRKGCWPYEIDNKGRSSIKGFSQSTTAMMIHAIDMLCNSNLNNSKHPYQFYLGDYIDDLKEVREKALSSLVEDISSNTKIKKKNKKESTTLSGTYGNDDPLTLYFLSSVLGVGAEENKQKEKIIDYLKNQTNQNLSFTPSSYGNDFFDFTEESLSKPLANAFVPLLVIRSGRLLENKTNATGYLRYFESTLHDQLSFSSIPDSRFDPAELIFCLEGMLRISKQSVDARLFERVLDVLEAAQNTSAHWRPSKPFLRTDRGMVLFPISVEAASSLCWSCEELDRDERFHAYSERYIALFRRFWEWLSARRVTLGGNKSGWHSDHVADPESIQLWDTAQVVGFLIGFRRSLHNHIARTTLRLSRFTVRKSKKAKMPWSENTKDRQAKRGFLEIDKSDKKTICKEYEPVSSLGGYFKTYNRIERDFLEGWLCGKPKNFSMLLYGPPGTGKSTVAENLADALGFPLITITVSDFLAAGGGEVEARAKMIFDVLEAQANVIILFDEIDEMVLDRSSELYGKQETVFKFMTPSMLTKLNNLRRAERSIFIMATNYAYRIDPAIRRTGRIDQNYLLLPPDAASREKILKGQLGKKASNKIKDWTCLLNASFLLGYKDIESVVKQINLEDISKGDEFKRFILKLEGVARTTTLRLYNKAYAETENRQAIEGEFFPLVKMTVIEGKYLKECSAQSPIFDNKELWCSSGGRKPYFLQEEDFLDKAEKEIEKRMMEFGEP